MMAIHFAILHFRPYLLGRKFKVKTDHKPLVHMFSMKNPTSKVVRMRLDLNEYDFEIEHIPGKENIEADAISRIDFNSIRDAEVMIMTRSMARKAINHQQEKAGNPHFTKPVVYDALTHTEIKGLPKLKLSFSEVAVVYEVKDKRSLLFNDNIVATSKNLKENDALLKALFRELQTRAKEKKIDKLALQYTDDVFRYVSPTLFKEEASKYLNNLEIILFSPRKRVKDPQEIQEILSNFHDDPMSGHPGQTRMLEKIKRNYSWKNMKSDVKNFVNKCDKCKLNKSSPATKQPFELTTTPLRSFDLVSVDTVGPLPTTSTGNKYILTIQCDFSKYVVYVPTKEKTAKSIAEALVSNVILLFGPMKQLKSDQGTEYVNEILKDICIFLNIEKLTATAYHPQTIGGLERNHRVLNEYLRTTLPLIDEWYKWLPFYAFAYNTTPNTVHGFSPFELVFGRQPNLPQDLGCQVDPLYNYDAYAKEIKFKLQVASSKTRELLLKHKKNTIAKQTEINPLDLVIGDKVKLINEQENKLSPKYSGPYVVTDCMNNNCEILNTESGKKTIVHKNRLLKY